MAKGFLPCSGTSNTRDNRDNLHKPEITDMGSPHTVVEKEHCWA